MLTTTLNSWASGTLYVSSGGVDSDVGLALVELSQTKSADRFKTRDVSGELIRALDRLKETSTKRSGSLAYLGIMSLGLPRNAKIYIVKPAIRGSWTPTAALNDAADLYAHIAEARSDRSEFQE